MSTKTDLAKEIIDKNFPEYSKKKTFFRGETKITRILIETDSDAEKIEKPKGRYVDMEADSIRFPYGKFDGEAFALAEELAELLPEKGDILLVGLGNRNLTADSLGVMTAEKALCGNFGERKLLRIIPGTKGAFGTEPERIISAAVREFSPAAVIAVDSLAAEDFSHICRSIEITDSGIAPGSGISKRKNALSEKTLGVPVIAVGTPTMIRYPFLENVFVAPNDIDVLINHASALLGTGISLAVFPRLGIDFIKGTAI